MKAKDQVLLVVNPVSGDLDKEELIDIVKNEINKRRLTLEIFKTSGKKDKEGIQEVLEKNDFKRILIAGGDGTIQLVALALKGKDIAVGILPAGSANGLAVDLALPPGRKEQLDIAFSESFLNMDILYLNKKIGIHISDLGLNAELVKNYENSSIRGKIGYALQSIPTFINCEYPFDFEIMANGKTFHTTGILLAIANGNKFGTGANINPEGKLNDGKFEVIIFKNLDVIEVFKTLYDPVVPSPEFCEFISTSEAQIKCKKPVPFQIDGQFQGETKSVHVTLAPEKLKMAVPSSLLSEA